MSCKYLVQAQSNPAKLLPQSFDFNAGGRWYKTGHIFPLAQPSNIGHHIDQVEQWQWSTKTPQSLLEQM